MKQSLADEIRNFFIWILLGIILSAYKLRTVILYILIPIMLGYSLAHIDDLIKYALQRV